MQLNLSEARLFWIRHYLRRHDSWTLIGFTGCWSWSRHPRMMVPTNGSTDSSRILIQRLITILNFSSLLELIFDNIHIFLWSTRRAYRILLQFQCVSCHFLVFITLQFCYLGLIQALSMFLILASERCFAAIFPFGF